jgi:bifunctional lysine-specific demethylase and histidyl-hydroxylase NO66
VLTLSDFLAPLSEAEFRQRHEGRAPVHIRGDAARARAVLDWAAFNTLLDVQSHWTESRLRLVMNRRPVMPEHYLDEVTTVGGRTLRAAPAKVSLFAAMGASIVANDVQDVSAPVRALCATLGQAFAGQAQANVYCSFQDIQAFGAHYDLHEVFALQCEGEKIWRLYSNREPDPVDPPPHDDAARERLDASKGELMTEVRMAPGDVLYIPRGWYHDALATSEASLHLTLSVTPLNGRDALDLLLKHARSRDVVRAYLPDARKDNGAALRERLAALAEDLSTLLRSPGFFTDLATTQRAAAPQDLRYTLPQRPPLRWFRNTGVEARVALGPAGAVLESQGSRIALGLLRDAADYVLSRPALSQEEVAARFPHLSGKEMDDLFATFRRIGVLAPYEPGFGG